jgi:hypothetical protein
VHGLHFDVGPELLELDALKRKLFSLLAIFNSDDEKWYVYLYAFEDEKLCKKHIFSAGLRLVSSSD